MSHSVESTWEQISQRLQDAKPGQVEQDGPEERSVGGKIKDWVWGKVKSGWNWASGKVVDLADKALNNRITGLILKEVELPEYLVYKVVGWGIDYFGDKLKGKLKVQVGKDTAKPSGGTQEKNLPAVVDLKTVVRDLRGHGSAITTALTEHIGTTFKKFYDTDESVSIDKGSTHSTGTGSIKTSGSSSSDVNVSHGNITAGGQSGSTSDVVKEDDVSTTRTYSGTTVKVTVGHPESRVTIREK